MSKETKDEVAVNGNTAVAEKGSFNATLAVNALKEAMEGECQGLEFTFDKVALPTGGGTAFQIPTADQEEPEMVKELKGVIIYNLPAYSYYKDKFNGQNNPPDCYSIDGVNGYGTPGCECSKCPYNKFGSGENNGKACKNKRMLYLLMEGEMFPLVIYLPAGSIKAFTQFIKSNLSKGRRLSQIVTKITLKKAVNQTGIAYSQAVFSFDRVLTPDENESLKSLIDFVKEYSKKRALSIVNEAEDTDLPFTEESEEKPQGN